MPTLRYEVLDVFTDTPYAGNPLAVVLGADDLTTTQLQAIAGEFNLSETAFPMRTDKPEATYRLRIFTPAVELPFAGHPSVGAAWLMTQRGLAEPVDGLVLQDCAAGVLPLRLLDDGRIELTGATPSAGEPLDPTPILDAVGLTAADLGPAPPRLCSTGFEQGFLCVADDAVARARPDLAKLRALAEHVGTGTWAVFSWDAIARSAHTRVFPADIGIAEDPATGSAAGGFGAWLAASGLLPSDAETAYVIHQGLEMGRPSQLDGTVVTRNGVAIECRVAGHTVAIATGQIAVPPALS